MRVFQAVDLNGDGTLSREEMKEVFQDLDADFWDDKRIGQMLEIADISGDGVIQYDEFVAWLSADEGDEILAKYEEAILAHRSKSNSFAPIRKRRKSLLITLDVVLVDGTELATLHLHPAATGAEIFTAAQGECKPGQTLTKLIIAGSAGIRSKELGSDDTVQQLVTAGKNELIAIMESRAPGATIQCDGEVSREESYHYTPWASTKSTNSQKSCRRKGGRRTEL